MRVEIRNIEFHVTHACNLTCDNCSHFSDYRFKGNIDLESAGEQWGHWSDRILPKDFSLLGGEPTIHPDLCDFLILAREHWPDSDIQLVSNGWFLHRHPDLPKVLYEINGRLEVSQHHDGPEYREKFAEILALVEDWRAKHPFRFHHRQSFDKWRRLWKLHGPNVKPYTDNNPAQSWKQCWSKWCPQIFEGNIYKCPPVAYLPMLDDKVGLSEDWKPYLAYEPLRPGCSDEELREFLNRETESCCAMCPANPLTLRLPSPIPGKS